MSTIIFKRIFFLITCKFQFSKLHGFDINFISYCKFLISLGYRSESEHYILQYWYSILHIFLKNTRKHWRPIRTIISFQKNPFKFISRYFSWYLDLYILDQTKQSRLNCKIISCPLHSIGMLICFTRYLLLYLYLLQSNNSWLYIIISHAKETSNFVAKWSISGFILHRLRNNLNKNDGVTAQFETWMWIVICIIVYYPCICL